MDIKKNHPESHGREETPASNEFDFEITISAKTEAAKKHGKRNEDRIKFRKKFQIVCDGLGGEEGGEDAAEETANRLEEALSKSTNLDPNSAQSEITKTLYDLDKEIKASSTTVALVYFPKGKDGKQKAVIAHIGDSRVYLYGRKEDNTYELEELTLDDNVVKDRYPQEAKRLQKAFSNTVDGSDLEEEDRNIFDDVYKYINIVYQSVGKKRIKAGVNIKVIDVKDGDRFLLCSDGLTANLMDVEIKDILDKTEDTSTAVEDMFNLVHKNNRNDDDISVILVRIKK